MTSHDSPSHSPAGGHRPRRRGAVELLRCGVSWFSPRHLLAALVLLFVATPFIDRPPYGELVETAAITVVLLGAVLAVGGNARTLVIGAVLVAPALVARWIDHFAPDVLPTSAGSAASVLFLGFVAFQLLRFVLRSSEVTVDIVAASISTYLLLGLMWAAAYVFAEGRHPGSFALFGTPMTNFTWLDGYYFSFITLISVGYGDITPLTRTTQMLAIVEGMTGMFFLVTVIARLVGHYTPGGSREKRST